MIERGPASEDEVICAFVRAEIGSSRYQKQVEEGLLRFGVERSVIDAPNLTDPRENMVRRRLLDYRGYVSRQGLFTGFPFDVAWRRVKLDADDFHCMRYIKDTVTDTPHWTNLSSGTRLVSDGASNLRRQSPDSVFQHIFAIARAVRDGTRLDPLIAAQHHQDYLVLVEGHSRATAYALERFSGEVDAFVGCSPSMDKWPFY
jgi:hypothetical protein